MRAMEGSRCSMIARFDSVRFPHFKNVTDPRSFRDAQTFFVRVLGDTLRTPVGHASRVPCDRTDQATLPYLTPRREIAANERE